VQEVYVMTRKRTLSLLSSIALLLLGASGCSDDDIVPDAGTPDLQVAVDTAVDQSSVKDQAMDQAPFDGPGEDSLVVTVLSIEADHWDPHGSHPGWLLVDSTTSKPLASATVAADLPGGKRVELTSASDGTVTFPDVDWKQGTAAVTGFATGHVMRSLMGITKADGQLTLYLIKYKTQPDMITVTGKATDMDAQKTSLKVGATTWGTPYYGLFASYAVKVEKGKPFSLYGVQRKTTNVAPLVNNKNLGFAKVDHIGATSDVTLDISFTTKVTPVTVTGTMEVPTAAGSKVAKGTPRWWVHQRGTSAILGFTTETTKGTGGQFSYTGEYVLPINTAGVITTYYSGNLAGGIWHGSYIEVDGFPKPAAKVDRFLEVPEMVKPTPIFTIITPVPMTDPIEWTNPEPAATPLIRIYHSTSLAYAWIVETKTASTKVTLPKLPSTATVAAVFGTGASSSGRVVLCSDRDVAKQWCARHADGMQFWFKLAP
jgi:hypothetical protein